MNFTLTGVMNGVYFVMNALAQLLPLRYGRITRPPRQARRSKLDAVPKLSDLFPVPEEARKLAYFLGDWIAGGRLIFRNRNFRIDGSFRFSLAAAGWGVLNVGKLEVEGVGIYEEVDLLGHDPATRSFHFFAVTNTGAARDHQGEWLGNDTLSLTHDSLHEGRAYREELELRILAPQRFTVSERDILDGLTVTSLDVAVMRKGSSPLSCSAL